MKISGVLTVFFAWAVGASAYSLSYQKAYQLIAEKGESLRYSQGNHGALCEVLAVAKMQELFPDAQVKSGIKYAPLGGPVRGELDVVVFSEAAPTMVIEVKCSRKFSSAAAKADSQLRRFSGVAGQCDHSYWGPSNESYSCEDFQGQKTYHKMSYSDASFYGFDLNFDLSRSQILRLISEL